MGGVIRHGDRVRVVLECVRTEKSGIPMRRVFMRGVYPYDAPGTSLPATYEGAVRNEVGAFFGLDMGVAAFLIECPPEEGEFADACEAALSRVRGQWADLFAGYGHGDMTTGDAEEIARAAVEAALPVIREQVARELGREQGRQPAAAAEPKDAGNGR